MRILALFLCCASIASAQSDSARSLSSRIADDFVRTLSGTGEYITSPLRFSQADWLRAGGVLAGTALLMTQDGAIHDALHATGRDSYNGDFWDAPTYLGDYIGAGGIAALLYGIGLAGGSENVRETGRMIAEGVGSAALAALTVRFLSGRSRPYTGDGPWHFRPLGWNRDHQSFASGHTATAFALCTVLAERIGSTWSRVGFYSLGLLTAAARVRNNQHWPTDVVMGAALGVTAGLHAVGGDEDLALRLLPGAGSLTVVVVLPLRFGQNAGR
jgi:membrane-associated phospholipid phosphatase